MVVLSGADPGVLKGDQIRKFVRSHIQRTYSSACMHVQLYYPCRANYIFKGFNAFKPTIIDCMAKYKLPKVNQKVT